MATIEERIAVLDEFVLEDEQPNIEAPSDSIYYESYGFRNYADRGAFETAWGEETVIMAKMNEILKQGEFFINMVYTYRSCSKAIPTVFLYSAVQLLTPAGQNFRRPQENRNI